MTDLAPVVASSKLINPAGNLIGAGTAGEACEIFDVLRLNGNKYYKSESDTGTQADADCDVIALSRATANGEGIIFGKPGLKIYLGITIAAGVTDYYVSNNAGKIAPFSDLSSTDEQTRVGIIEDSNVFHFTPQAYLTPIP